MDTDIAYRPGLLARSALCVATAGLLVGVLVPPTGAAQPDQDSFSPESAREGKIIWWGMGRLFDHAHSDHTNGVVEIQGKIPTNIVDVAVVGLNGFALRNDGTVATLGFNFEDTIEAAAGLSNVVSMARAGYSLRAFHRDGSVTVLVGGGIEQEIFDALTNVTSIASVGAREYVALERDGQLLGVQLQRPGFVDATERSGSAQFLVGPVAMGGDELRDVMDLVSWGVTPLVLRTDGSVSTLKLRVPFWPLQFDLERIVEANGRQVTNVASLIGGEEHVLALNRDGTVIALGSSDRGGSSVPPGLGDVVSVSAARYSNLALKRDGTVVAWGGSPPDVASVPAGLSNVVAIAAGDTFNLAVTTGAVPANVYVTPHGRIETMERDVDLVFKGRVLSSRAVTNTAFPYWGKPRVTQFEIISTLKGDVSSNRIAFHHLTGQPDGWSGGSPPAHFTFESGQCYLVFAVHAATPDWLYSPASNLVVAPNELRQPMRGDYAVRTLDARRIEGLSPKEAHWAELKRGQSRYSVHTRKPLFYSMGIVTSPSIDDSNLPTGHDHHRSRHFAPCRRPDTKSPAALPMRG